MIGNLLELLPADLVVDEQDPGHNTKDLVQQVHLCDCVLLVSWNGAEFRIYMTLIARCRYVTKQGQKFGHVN